MTTKYNGWTNYETWVVNLWFDGVFQDAAKDYTTETVGEFADYIEECVRESLPNVSGLASDLLSASLSVVNWYEIAKNYLED